MKIVQLIAASTYCKRRAEGHRDLLVPGDLEPVWGFGLRDDGKIVALVQRDGELIDATTLPTICQEESDDE